MKTLIQKVGNGYMIEPHHNVTSSDDVLVAESFSRLMMILAEIFEEPFIPPEPVQPVKSIPIQADSEGSAPITDHKHACDAYEQTCGDYKPSGDYNPLEEIRKAGQELKTDPNAYHNEHMKKVEDRQTVAKKERADKLKKSAGSKPDQEAGPENDKQKNLQPLDEKYTAQIGVLDAVCFFYDVSKKPVLTKQLARKMDVDHSSVNQALRTLENKGFIFRQTAPELQGQGSVPVVNIPLFRADGREYRRDLDVARKAAEHANKNPPKIEKIKPGYAYGYEPGGTKVGSSQTTSNGRCAP